MAIRIDSGTGGGGKTGGGRTGRERDRERGGQTQRRPSPGTSSTYYYQEQMRIRARRVAAHEARVRALVSSYNARAQRFKDEEAKTERIRSFLGTSQIDDLAGMTDMGAEANRARLAGIKQEARLQRGGLRGTPGQRPLTLQEQRNRLQLLERNLTPEQRQKYISGRRVGGAVPEYQDTPSIIDYAKEIKNWFVGGMVDPSPRYQDIPSNLVGSSSFLGREWRTSDSSINNAKEIVDWFVGGMVNPFPGLKEWSWMLPEKVKAKEWASAQNYAMAWTPEMRFRYSQYQQRYGPKAQGFDPQSTADPYDPYVKPDKTPYPGAKYSDLPVPDYTGGEMPTFPEFTPGVQQPWFQKPGRARAGGGGFGAPSQGKGQLRRRFDPQWRRSLVSWTGV